MIELLNVPFQTFKHDSAKSAFDFRISKIKEIISKFARDPRWILFTKGLLIGLNPPRYKYDFEVSQKIYNYLKRNVPFRRDQSGIEVLQYPDITLKRGGDCDCLVILAGTCLNSVGVQNQLAVSMQNSDEYDHIFLVIPSCNNLIFDLTNDSGFNASKAGYKNMRILK